MALEVFVSPFLGVVFENLSSLLRDEIGVVLGVNKEKLSITLSTIRDVLEDAETKQTDDKPINNWLKKLKDLAYDAADILDECAIKALLPESDIVRNSSCNIQVDSSLNVPAKAEVVVEIPETVSLPHRRDNETGRFDTESPEGQETSLGVANDHDSGVSSQPSQQPSLPAESAIPENEAQNPDLKTEFKVAILVITISSGAMVGALPGLLGKEKATLNHKILVKAFWILNYVSLVLGVGLFVLTLTRPNIPCLVKIAKFIMWIAIGSTTYALCSVTSLQLSKLVEVAIILVVPLVMFCSIAALSWGGWNK